MDDLRILAWWLLWLGTIAVAQAADTSSMSAGGHLQIDLIKRNSTELARTNLAEPNIAPFSGSVPLASIAGIVGELVPFSPLDGCSPLQFNPLFHQRGSDGDISFRSQSNSTSYIVLMRRGKCDYTAMLKRASAVPHVVGILVYDGEDRGGSELFITSDAPLVPAFLVSRTLGDDLLKKANKYREWANSTQSDPDDNPWVQITMRYIPIKVNIAKALQIFLIIVVVALILALIISLFWNYSVTRQRLAPDHPEPPPRRKPENIPIDDEFIGKIPLRTYRSPNSSPLDINGDKKNDENSDPYVMDGDGEEDYCYRRRLPHNETCPICLDEFQYGVEIHQLHCGHCYHPICIVPWLQNRSPLCPLCKIDVRVSLIETEELAFVRSLRRKQRDRRSMSMDAEVPGKPIQESNAEVSEMKEVCVMSPSASLRGRNASFDSIPLEPEPRSSFDHYRRRSTPIPP